MEIQNQNIKRRIQELMKDLISPQCANCQKRRADRVCVNKQCGIKRYQSLICCKCLYEEHQRCEQKSYIDTNFLSNAQNPVEGYFMKFQFHQNISYNNKTYLITQKGVQIEMRIDFQNNFIDFYDYYKQKLIKSDEFIFSNDENEITFQFNNTSINIVGFQELIQIYQKN